MDYIIIEVPDMNDSISKISLLGTQYQLRFTWNEACQCWSFGLLDALGDPLAIGIKIIPNFPLNLFCGAQWFPKGFFAALTKAERIGRKDFVTESAKFVFVPA